MLSSLKFHHIGIAVFDIDVTARYYTESGYTKTETVIDPIQNIQICFLRKTGMPTLELLAPVDINSPVNNILGKIGVSPYHCCYEVEDIKQAISDLKRKKFVPLSSPVPACAISSKAICFLFNKDVGLIELVES